MKSAKQAYVYPVQGETIGDIPKWIEGRLYRIGPGKFEVGSDNYNHLFDGLGMVQRYSICDGCVIFNSQYVQSNSYLKNMAANRIIMSEFGTVGFPDPCHNIFNRLSVMFYQGITDNTNVCVYPIGDELFSATETNVIHRINPQDLSTIGSVRLDKVLSIHRATAHNHVDNDTGLVHLLGFINSPPSYALVTLPSIKKEESAQLNGKYDMEILLAEAKIVAKVNTRWKLNPSYFHSFGMTENYYILLECPLALSVVQLLKAKIFNSSFANSLKWWSQEKTMIHIINKKSGELLPNTYITDPLFTFHHINAYEEDDHVIIDYVGYNDGQIIIKLFKESLDETDQNIMFESRPRRLVVPINVDEKIADNVNLIKLKDVTATAKRISRVSNRSTIYCTQEELSADTFLELPTINYNMYNGKRYRYVYGVNKNKLFKIDVLNKETFVWESDVSESEVGEAVFVSNPRADKDNMEDEDFGVLLAPVIFNSDNVKSERFQSLLIIDAKSMQELGRSEFKSVSIPITFHGNFINN